jgi:propanol-preferring alcohol dehydrogenase
LSLLVPGSVAVVIGVGGLGHMAVQILRAITATRIIALDVSDERLEMARQFGAHEAVPSDESAVGRVRDLAGGAGVEAVFDFVGANATLQMAARMIAPDGHISVVGIGGGEMRFGFGRLPYGVTADCPFAGTCNDLVEVVELARAGAIRTHVETFSLDDVPRAYELLHAGKINGRGVAVFEVT